MIIANERHESSVWKKVVLLEKNGGQSTVYPIMCHSNVIMLFSRRKNMKMHSTRAVFYNKCCIYDASAFFKGLQIRTKKSLMLCDIRNHNSCDCWIMFHKI